MFFKKRGPKKYSMERFQTLTDEEFYVEREPIRQAYCRGDPGTEKLLDLFNRHEAERLNARYRKEYPEGGNPR